MSKLAANNRPFFLMWASREFRRKMQTIKNTFAGVDDEEKEEEEEEEEKKKVIIIIIIIILFYYYIK